MRAARAFHLIDVFTRDRFDGAKLVVIECTEAPTRELQQRLGREFGAAAAFLTPPADQINSARVDCLSMQGDPVVLSPEALIGAATVLARLRAGEILAQRGVVVALEACGQTYACDVIRGASGAPYAQVALGLAPHASAFSPDAEALAQSLGLSIAELRFGRHEPRAFEALGSYIYAPAQNRETLYRAHPRVGAISDALGDARGLFLYAADPVERDAAIHARLFTRDGGEAPVCAEAVAGFAGVALAFERPADGCHEFIVEQGHGAGRPARVTLRMDVDDGALIDVGIGGQTALVASGTLTP